MVRRVGTPHPMCSHLQSGTDDVLATVQAGPRKMVSRVGTPHPMDDCSWDKRLQSGTGDAGRVGTMRGEARSFSRVADDFAYNTVQ